MSKEPTTAWMWPVNGGDVHGANIDTVKARIHWFDNGIGCACGDSTAVQSYADFREKGAPIGSIPDDINAEIMASLAALEA